MSEPLREVFIWNDPDGWLVRGFEEDVPEGVTAYPLGGHAPVVREDTKPHFNRSLMEHVGSRADMMEKAKRQGMRPVEHMGVDDVQRKINEHEARRTDQIHHPEKYGGQSFEDFHYETFHGPGGEKNEVREAIESSRRERNEDIRRRWEKGRR